RNVNRFRRTQAVPGRGSAQRVITDRRLLKLRQREGTVLVRRGRDVHSRSCGAAANRAAELYPHAWNAEAIRIGGGDLTHASRNQEGRWIRSLIIRLRMDRRQIRENGIIGCSLERGRQNR